MVRRRKCAMALALIQSAGSVACFTFQLSGGGPPPAARALSKRAAARHSSSPADDNDARDLGRRPFVLSSAATSLVAATATATATATAPRAARAAAPARRRPIERAAGALTSLPLTVGLGTCLVSDGSVEEQVGLALDAGYRVFDTAQRYQNEGGVGRALRSAIGAGRVTRDELFVTTKVCSEWLPPLFCSVLFCSVR